ncbi:MAG: hypothetical protein NC132_06415 [Corallococcus sp.]|nr:hypothetical protein [Corallococcus sp.]MCM1359757.1 hypothetical protein [Corallococcus sp.]MCM1395717.1 hypothetical protein [Corallococcus sp.]
MDFTQTDFSRVAVIGCPGSGKTTLALQLGQILGKPVIHLDKVLWNKNWQMLPFEERQTIHDNLIAQDGWLIDGMWRSHLDARFQRATLVIFLDYQRRLCMFRAVSRFFKYRKKQRFDIADGCLEKLDAYFVKYIWTFKKNVRPQILQLAEDNAQVRVITLHSPKQTKKFVQQLQQRFSAE